MQNDLPQRKNIRLKDYDYSKEGMYFITICTKNRECILLTDVGADASVCPKIALTKIGRIINECWCNIEKINNNTKLHKFIIMPDHIHGIIEITGGQRRPPLHKIIQEFKSITARKCFEYGYKSIWQRNYYEHIIRNEKEYYKIYEYIENNLINWDKDKYKN